MRSSMLHALVFGCSLLLALPPGWCCMFGSCGHEQDAPRTRRCCRGCCGGDGVRSPAPVPTTPKPAPPRPDHCPCADRLSTTPDTAKVIPGNLLVAASLNVLDFSPDRPAAGRRLGLSSPAVATAIRLLNCLWLC